MTYELVIVETPSEWEVYHRIRREELFEARGRFGMYDPDRPEERLPENTNLLLKKDGVGVATTRFDMLGNGTAAIRLVAVDKPLQGAGVGRVLAQKTMAFAREQGVNRLVVNAHPTAVGYYERSGFRHEAWNPEELTGIASNCVQMVLDVE